MTRSIEKFLIRARAAIAGEQYYESDPCRACGGTIRYVTSGACTTCRKSYQHRVYREERKLIAKARSTEGKDP